MSSTRSPAFSNALKRKYDRQPETEAMIKLRAEAVKAIRKRLGLSIDLKNVNLNGKPFPSKKTIYLWRPNPNVTLTAEERQLLDRTVEGDRARQQFPWKWSDNDRLQLGVLIRNETLIPQYHDRSNSGTVIPPDAWDPLTGESATDEDRDTEVEELPQRLKRPGRWRDWRLAKRRRASSPGNDTENPTTETGAVPQKSYAQDTTENTPDNSTASPTPTLSDNPAPTRERLMLTLRIPKQASSPVLPDKLSASIDEVPNSAKDSPPPRTMTSNANGILELNPLLTMSPTVLYKRPTAGAPVASSPFTPMINALALYTEQNKMDNSDCDGDAGKELAAVGIEDMKRCMEAFIGHATVGYFGMPQLRKDKRAMKAEYEEKIRILIEKEARLERQMKILCARENGLKERISELETTHGIREKELKESISILETRDNTREQEWTEELSRSETSHRSREEELVKRITGLEAINAETSNELATLKKAHRVLQEEKVGLRKLQDDMRDKNKTLEQDLCSSKESEGHIREAYKTLESDMEKLRQSKDHEIAELQQQISVFRESQSELQSRLETSLQTYISKEATLQERIEDLESHQDSLLQSLTNIISQRVKRQETNQPGQ